jgi:hypothetical protein
VRCGLELEGLPIYHRRSIHRFAWKVLAISRAPYGFRAHLPGNRGGIGINLGRTSAYRRILYGMVDY